MIRQCEIILFISDQKRSRDFYRELLQCEPVLDVPGMTEFILFDNCKLGLLQDVNAFRILKIDPTNLKNQHEEPRCEMYLTVDDPEACLARAVTAGARKISGPEPRNWGDIAAYCTDPDGHVIAFAKRI